MKNMTPSITRPASIVTKTVNNNLRKGMPMPGNNGPCCSVAAKVDRVPGVSKDVCLKPSRTVYASGF